MAFTLISDPRVTSILVKESGDALVDASQSPVLAMSPKRVKVNPWCWHVRQVVLVRLEQAARALPDGVHLCLEEGFRTTTLQSAIFTKYLSELQASDSSLRDDQLMAEATKYVAPPNGTPPHTTGGAVDVALLDESGFECDMGSKSDDTPLSNGKLNFTRCGALPPPAARHRAVLVAAMSLAGFVNYPAEWWHWSYGDQYWAYRVRRRTAIFQTVSAESLLSTERNKKEKDSWRIV